MSATATSTWPCSSPTTRRADNLNREIFRTAVEAGGAISGEHGIGTAKMSYFVETVDPAQLSLMRAIKAAFDPRGILGPGRMPGTAEASGTVRP